jgi:phosphomannomutase
VDEKGRYITPCFISAILLDYLVKNKKLKGKVVQTFSMGYLNKRVARHYGMAFEEVGIGFKNIAEKMTLEDVAFGVEEAGGYSWKGVPPDRDGLLVAMMFLEIMAVTGKKPGELCDDIVKQYGASVYLRSGYALSKPVEKGMIAEKLKKKMPKKIAGLKVADVYTTDGIKIVFEGEEWLLIRPSGTEPLLRVYAEAAVKKQTEELLEAGYKMVLPLLK